MSKLLFRTKICDKLVRMHILYSSWHIRVEHKRVSHMVHDLLISQQLLRDRNTKIKHPDIISPLSCFDNVSVHVYFVIVGLIYLDHILLIAGILVELQGFKQVLDRRQLLLVDVHQLGHMAEHNGFVFSGQIVLKDNSVLLNVVSKINILSFDSSRGL